LKYAYRELPEGINNPPANHLKEVVVLACGLVAGIAGLFFILGLTANRLVESLSPETERRLAGMISIPVDPSRQTPDEQAGQVLLDALVLGNPAVKGPLRVKIACSPQVNALALPGGTVLLFSGLVSRLRSENEFAMVLGHEAGHFAARDHLKGLGRTLVVMALTTTLFGTQDGVPSFLKSLVGISSFRFSRAQEEAADSFGARLVNQRYGHAAGVVDFFETLAEEEDRSELGAWFSTHPSPESRIGLLDGLIAREGWPRQPVKPFDGRDWAARCREPLPAALE
jgi:Zn-dependent protease with chaperone function